LLAQYWRVAVLLTRSEIGSGVCGALVGWDEPCNWSWMGYMESTFAHAHVHTYTYTFHA